MTNDLHLSGPTVTLFGDRDALEDALGDELGRRGCSIHSVTIPMGWLSTVTHAVVRLETPTGEQALTDLTSRDVPAAHVVAVYGTDLDGDTSARLDELCRTAGEHHAVSVIRHAPLGPPVQDAPFDLTPAELAGDIADEIARGGASPSFVSRTVEPRRDGAQD